MVYNLIFKDLLRDYDFDSIELNFIRCEIEVRSKDELCIGLGIYLGVYNGKYRYSLLLYSIENENIFLDSDIYCRVLLIKKISVESDSELYVPVDTKTTFADLQVNMKQLKSNILKYIKINTLID